jgi:hypothetical protein
VLEDAMMLLKKAKIMCTRIPGWYNTVIHDYNYLAAGDKKFGISYFVLNGRETSGVMYLTHTDYPKDWLAKGYLPDGTQDAKESAKNDKIEGADYTNVAPSGSQADFIRSVMNLDQTVNARPPRFGSDLGTLLQDKVLTQLCGSICPRSVVSGSGSSQLCDHVSNLD